jgi:hypothetical protein
MKMSVLVLLVLATVIAGCNEATSKKAAEPAKPAAASTASPADNARKLILRYNTLLSNGYKTNNMTQLQEVATQELAQKAYYHMAAIIEGKSRMVSELKRLEVREADCTQPARCRMVTRETWDFAYADQQTGKRSSEVKDYVYDVQYLIEQRQGRWLITEITASGEERKELPSWNKMFNKK